MMAETTSIHTNKKSVVKSTSNKLQNMTHTEALDALFDIIFQRLDKQDQIIGSLQKEVRELSSRLEIEKL